MLCTFYILHHTVLPVVLVGHTKTIKFKRTCAETTLAVNPSSNLKIKQPKNSNSETIIIIIIMIRQSAPEGGRREKAKKEGEREIGETEIKRVETKSS